MRSLIFALGILSFSTAALAADYDIPWFEAHTAQRQEALKMCRNDYRYARKAICANAETADARAYYQRRNAQAGQDTDPPSAIWRDAVRRTCARPPSERSQILGADCGRY